ncbi:hypothetical protein HOF92_13935, partial [bacterium]|nr:hypothetical protein [bacterium]
MKLGPAQIRDLLIKSSPTLGLGDFFLSGFDFHALHWGIRSLAEVQIDFVGGSEGLSSGGGIARERIRIHESMSSFDEFLRSKPFEFQRFSYSLRLGQVFRGEISGQPREVRCTGIVMDSQDRAHILELCLQFHVELSRLCKHGQFPVLSLQECVDLGFFRWISQESFMAFFLSDLLHNS